MGTIILSALVAHTGVALDDRALASGCGRFRFEWPELDAAFLAGAMRWMMVVLAAAAVAWFVRLAARSRTPQRSGRS